MFVVFRCDCGRVLYCKDYLKSHKCGTCNKTIRLKDRRILFRTDDITMAREQVMMLQDKFYHNTGFVTGDKL